MGVILKTGLPGISFNFPDTCSYTPPPKGNCILLNVLQDRFSRVELGLFIEVVCPGLPDVLWVGFLTAQVFLTKCSVKS